MRLKFRVLVRRSKSTNIVAPSGGISVLSGTITIFARLIFQEENTGIENVNFS